jgi:hypothetical protein
MWKTEFALGNTSTQTCWRSKLMANTYCTQGTYELIIMHFWICLLQEKINVILGLNVWHFQKSNNKVCRWRRLLSCLSQEYLKKIPRTWDNFFVYTSRTWICALR